MSTEPPPRPGRPAPAAPPRPPRPGRPAPAAPPRPVKVRGDPGLVREPLDHVDRLVRVVGQREEAGVAGRDVAALHERPADPVEQAAPVRAPHEDDREPGRLPRLDQRQALEQLVHRPEPAGQDDVALGVLDEHRLPGEEEVEHEVLVRVDVRVRPLLVGEHDVEPDRGAAALLGPLVRGLHDPRPAARDDGVAPLGEPPPDGHPELVVLGPRRRPGRPEHGHARADRREPLEPLDELAHDPEHAPRVLGPLALPRGEVARRHGPAGLERGLDGRGLGHRAGRRGRGGRQRGPRLRGGGGRRS